MYLGQDDPMDISNEDGDTIEDQGQRSQATEIQEEDIGNEAYHPGASWNNRKAKEEARKANASLVDKNFSLSMSTKHGT